MRSGAVGDASESKAQLVEGPRLTAAIRLKQFLIQQPRRTERARVISARSARRGAKLRAHLVQKSSEVGAPPL